MNQDLVNEDFGAARCAEALTALADEIVVAIGAIARNALPELESSVARQHAMCSPLVSLYCEQFVLPETRQLDPRIVAASARLRRLNREYAALLQYSGRTLRMLQALHGTSTAASGAEPRLQAAPQPGSRRWQG